MVVFVTEVGQPCLFCADGGRKSKRFTGAEVGGVVGGTQGIDNEMVHTLDEVLAGGGDALDIGEVGDAAAIALKKKSVGFDGGVFDPKRRDAKHVELHRPVEQDGVGADVSFVACVTGLECPAEHGMQSIHAAGVCINGEAIIAPPTEGAELVKANDVVEVGVGVKDGINMGEIFAQRLLAEVRTGIDKDRESTALDNNG